MSKIIKVIESSKNFDIYEKEVGRLIVCPECNKPILERLTSGLWRFRFGKPRLLDENRRPVTEKGKAVFRDSPTPVIIYVHGSIRMKCFRTTCNKWFDFNYFPTEKDFVSIVKEKSHI